MRGETVKFINYICLRIRGLLIIFCSVTFQRNPNFSAMLVFLTAQWDNSFSKVKFCEFSKEGRGWRRCDYSVRRGIESGAHSTFCPAVNWLTPERVELYLHVPFSSHNIGLLIVQRDSIIIITATLKISEGFDFLVCYVARDGSCLLTFWDSLYVQRLSIGPIGCSESSITVLRRVTSQKSAGLNHIAAKAWKFT
jgi:hypothetical protein